MITENYLFRVLKQLLIIYAIFISILRSFLYLCLVMLDGFLTYIRSEKRYSEGTVKAYLRDVRIFIDFFEKYGEEFDVQLVTDDRIREWMMSLSESGTMSAVTINRMLCSVRAFFRYLQKQGYISKNPMLRINFMKTKSRLPVYITESKMECAVESMSVQEVEDDYITKRNTLIVLFFYSTGLRLSELVSIKIGDFSADMAELKVRGKGDKERMIPILDSLRSRLKEYLEYLDKIKGQKVCKADENSLFLTKEGAPITRIEVYRVVKRLLTISGVSGKVSPHVLRHTFATHMLNDGADMREIQEILGHSSLNTTQIYTHNSITKLKEVYKFAHPRAINKR